MEDQTIPTKFMVVSDTHEYLLDGTSMPHIDVLLHTGDLTNFGDLQSLRDAVKMMGTISAEIKLVIAGNHDLSLDKVNRVENMSAEEYAYYHAEAMDIMTGTVAKAAGVIYLQEGTYSFQLENGATFTVYASPYTPGSGGWAFPYSKTEDRYNPVDKSNSQLQQQEPLKPIPSGIDIVMTHGPPRSILDEVDGQNMGCPNLLHAIGRTRPLMHTFGHIHEGHAAHIVDWKPDNTVRNPAAATPLETEQMNEYPDPCEWSIKRGLQTLLVNAAIMRNTGRGMRPDYQPFIITLKLPKAILHTVTPPTTPATAGKVPTKKRTHEEPSKSSDGLVGKKRRVWV